MNTNNDNLKRKLDAVVTKCHNIDYEIAKDKLGASVISNNAIIFFMFVF
jgi:hypothetical protein